MKSNNILEKEIELLEYSKELLVARQPEEITQAAIKYMERLFPADAYAFWLLDEKNEQIILASFGGLVDLKSARSLKERCLTTDAFRNRQPILISDTHKALGFIFSEWARREKFRSLMAVPLLSRPTKAIGAITIGKKKPDEFNWDDLQLLSLFANQTAVALERAYMHQDRQSIRAKEKELLELSRMFLTIHEVNKIIEAAIIYIEKFFSPGAVAFWLYDEKNKQLVATFARGLPPPEHVRSVYARSISAEAFRRREPLLVQDYQEESGIPLADWAKQEKFCSLMSIPLLPGDRPPLGVITAADKTPHKYNESDLRLFALLGNQAATALERAQMHEALKRSEKRYRGFVENTPDFVFWLDQEGCITYVNQAFRDLLGYNQEELDGKYFLSTGLFFPDDVARVQNVFQELIGGVETKITGFELRLLAKTGELIYTEINGSILRNEQYAWIEGIGRDVTRRKLAEEELIRSNNELLELHGQLRKLSITDSLTGLYNRLYFDEELKRLSNLRQLPLSVIIVDIDELKLVNDSFGHGQGDKLIRATATLLKKCFRKNDVIARIGGDEFAVLLPRTNSKIARRRCLSIVKAIANHNQQNLLFPLSISIGWDTTESMEKTIYKTLKNADDQMYQQKLAKTGNYKKIIVQSLMDILIERGLVSRAQNERMMKMADVLGEVIGLAQEELAALKILVPVYEIGLIGISEEVLRKKGELTTEEKQEMRRHPEIGCRIALYLPDLVPVAEYILDHHECWDGSGYPKGLKGKQIPLLCRILAVVSAFAAMTGGEPGQDAMSREEAAEELKRNAGARFDPEIVKLFIEKALPKIEQLNG